jgi:hypothetical protein
MSHAIKIDLYAIVNSPLMIDLVDGLACTLLALEAFFKQWWP